MKLKSDLRPFIAVIFLLLSFCSKAQDKRKFVPGSYVTQKGDTIKGYIFMPPDNYIPRDNAFGTFNFKNQFEDISISVISYDSCRLISSGGESFSVWRIQRNMTYVDKFDFTIRNIDSNITAPIPLKLLYKGVQFSLYHYHDVKDHFFIYDGKTMQELLIQFRYLTAWEQIPCGSQTPQHYVIPVYHQQIMWMMNNQLTKRQQDFIESTDYETRPLVKLFKYLDHNKEK